MKEQAIIKWKTNYSRLLAGAAGLAVLAASVDLHAAQSETRQPIIGGDAPTTRSPEQEPTEFPQGPLFPYSLLDRALVGNVETDGSVRYSNLKDNKQLNWFLKAVATADLSKFPVFTFMEADPKTGRPTVERKNRTPELIFWINSYNGHILNAIAQAYPVKSIDDIKDFDTAKTRTVAGKNYSFQEMREKILSFGDPRVLFSLTTGTWGGFLPSPFAVRNVEFDERMNAAIRVFINDPRNVEVNRLQNVVTVSSTLKDASDHFKVSPRQKFEGIRQVLAGYSEGNQKGYFGSGSYRIEFKDADRNLNDRSMRGLSS